MHNMNVQVKIKFRWKFFYKSTLYKGKLSVSLFYSLIIETKDAP